ncbi:hypothetical protein [Streptomyces sp. ML-6]|uniref:hypothetical protein n=1 Tax=Streptomyces sp. ML-6 TaxID=2982693 RepID=UPI0024BFC049|nr:hypothetical protein [Streptomyces sp. ML-6]MDK0522854.1 hypothetical protein [Streptomyces sp. ML-6]
MNESQRTSYEVLKAGALDLASTWDGVAYRLGGETPPLSRCAQEAAVLPSGVEAPEKLTRTIAQDAATYVTAASQHVRALAGLLGPEAVLTGWSLTRALVEHCSRATWLLGLDVTPTGRVARFYMERIVSLHMARLAAEQVGNRKRAKKLKRDREALLSQARQVFPDIKLFKVEKLNDWAVGGETYAGLGKAVNGLGRDHLNTRGLYDMLSTFTHPSLYRLHAQTTVTQLEDQVHYAFTAHPDVIRWQIAVASGSVYRAAHHVVAYLQLDVAPLEQWADDHPELLAWSRSMDDPRTLR